MSNFLKWLLGIILLVVIGLVIWLVVVKPQPAEAPETPNTIPEQTVNPVLWISGFNQTQNQQISAVQSKPQDVLVFTLNAENKQSKVVTGFVMQTSIQDLVTGATLVDAGGAAYNAVNQTLSWTPQDIAPGQVIARTFSVRVNSISAESTAPTLRVSYNNEIQVSTSRATVAGTSTDAGNSTENLGKGYKAPKAGVPANLSLILGLATVAGYAAWQKFQIK